MSDFTQTMKDWRRMCNYYQTHRTCPMYCPMAGVNISQCRKFVYDNPEKAAHIIGDWAKQHHEPEYPTWYEYLSNRYRAAFGDIAVIARQPIPADIAEKLGIGPKEG